MEIVLASASPARHRLLTDAGVVPVVVVSAVDEDAILRALGPATPVEQVLVLAQAKARDAASRLTSTHDAVVIGCDSMLDVDGTAFGKPASVEEAKQRWMRDMAGRSAVLRTGHWLIRTSTGEEVGEVASTTVWHERLTEPEIDAYISTGEPLQVAGGFTLDGLGAPFVERIDGDPSNVVGLSLPLLRRLLGGLGIVWTDLWHTP